MIEKESIFKAWTIDLHERFPHWPYKKPKPGHEASAFWTGPRLLPPHDPWKNLKPCPLAYGWTSKRPLPPLEHPVLTVAPTATTTPAQNTPTPRRSRSASPTTTAVSGRDCMEQVRAVETRR